ncbi:MAG: hypothetical protein D6806_00030 [Deltaproteobacteria bacterium]|nr:MAG: hypothetical protein D6806_00030 [Deltaproteobacteria bacterium]
MVLQEEYQVEIAAGEETERPVYLLSAVPLQIGGRKFALVVLQDVSELHRLRGLIPICSYCKKIRTDGDNWEKVEKFIANHSYAFLSHGICPDCLEKYYPESEATENEK